VFKIQVNIIHINLINRNKEIIEHTQLKKVSTMIFYFILLLYKSNENFVRGSRGLLINLYGRLYSFTFLHPQDHKTLVDW
jgi:hypothetical protein